MKLKLKDAIGSLDYDDLVTLNQDLREGGHEVRSMVEQNIIDKERESGKTCHVCSSEIDPQASQNYTITLGPEGLRRKASFCALDCLKFFITNIEKRNEEIKRRLEQNTTNNRMNNNRNGTKYCSGCGERFACATNQPAPIVAATMMYVSHCVTRAPPSLSASHPPSGRIKAPTPAPIQMKLAEIGAPFGGE